MVSNFQMYKEKQELCEFYSNPKYTLFLGA